ncbi:hypothetical protein [Nocardia sp. NBC_00416]|uniref:hypothetical protein n=1 Tax=Nocardia sp. NBC_00416 TaxID=2975991 RepID=UPI002E209E76
MATTSRWIENSQRTFILAVRRPGKYLFGASALIAGIASSLEVAEPARTALEAVPVVTQSDWLAYILVTGIVAGTIKVASLGLRMAVGREPFEVLAALIDRSGIAPDLTRDFERRIAGGLPVSEPMDYRSRPITARELDLLCQLNREVFGLTAFSTPLDVIKRRNRSSFEANPLVYRIVEARVGDQYLPVGMSSILPLNRLGEAEYCRTGGLPDSEVRGVHIAAADEWSDAVVLFSMGLIRSARGRLRGNSAVLPLVFLDHLVDIVSTMRAAHPERRTLRLYAQTEHVKGGIGRMLRRLDFADTGIVTGDGYPLWECTYDLHSAPGGSLAAEVGRMASARDDGPAAATAQPTEP